MTNADADPLSRLSLPQLPDLKPSSSLKERLDSARRLALAIQALHRQGQIHRCSMRRRSRSKGSSPTTRSADWTSPFRRRPVRSRVLPARVGPGFGG